MGKLRRSLGLWPAIATAVGIVVASTTLVSLGQGIGIAGYGFIYPMVFALILNVFVALTFSELSGMIPRAGSINHYTLPAMGPFMGMVAVISGYVLVSMFAGSAEVSVAGLVFHSVFWSGISPTLFAIFLVIIIAASNMLGNTVFSWIQTITTTFMIGSMIILGLVGIFGIGTGAPLASSTVSFNPMGWGVLALTPLAFWLFVGIEFVTPMAEELKKPNVYIPMAMLFGLAIIFVTDMIFGDAAIKYVPLKALAASPEPHVLVASAILGKTGMFWIGIVSLTATISTINTLLAAIPRMLYGMSLRGQMPKVFSKLNKNQSPWVAVFFLSGVFVIFLITGVATIKTIVIYILAAALSWFVAYIIAHLDLIILRYKYPDSKRPFKSPFWILPQVLGIAGFVYIGLNVFPDPAMKAEIYKYFIVFLGLTVAWSWYWIKFVMKEKLFHTVSLENINKTIDTHTLT